MVYTCTIFPRKILAVSKFLNNSIVRYAAIDVDRIMQTRIYGCYVNMKYDFHVRSLAIADDCYTVSLMAADL